MSNANHGTLAEQIVNKGMNPVNQAAAAIDQSQSSLVNAFVRTEAMHGLEQAVSETFMKDVQAFIRAAGLRVEAAEKDIARLQIGVGQVQAGVSTAAEEVRGLSAKIASRKSFAEELQELQDSNAHQIYASIDGLVRHADAQRLPWGVRQLHQARRSTFGTCLETVGLVALAGFSLYATGTAAYTKFSGSGDGSGT